MPRLEAGAFFVYDTEGANMYDMENANMYDT